MTRNDRLRKIDALLARCWNGAWVAFVLLAILISLLDLDQHMQRWHHAALAGEAVLIAAWATCFLICRAAVHRALPREHSEEFRT